MAKKTETKKVTKTDKDAEARAKVEELLKNTSVGNQVTNGDDKLDIKEIKKGKSMDWMQDTIAQLSEQVETLENEIIFYKEEMKKAQSNPIQPANNGVVNASLNPNVIALFKHFEGLYVRLGGDPMVKIAYPQTGNGILDKFIEYFPELQNVRTYKYRG